MGKYSGMPSNLLDGFQFETGMLLKSFDPTTSKAVSSSDIIGATTGGITFTDTPTVTDLGEDVDNCPGAMKELQRITSREVTLSSTFVSIDNTTIPLVMGPNTHTEGTGGTSEKIYDEYKPSDTLDTDDFSDIWWVGDYSEYNSGTTAGFIAIHLVNALSTGGFALTTSKGGKGTLAFTFKGHYSLSDITAVPYEIYIKKGTAETD